MFAISHFSGTEMGLNKISMSSNSSAEMYVYVSS